MTRPILTVGSGANARHYEPGIYFNMPFDEYLAIPCLSSSYLKKLLISPTDFWCTSWMNPLKKNKDTEANIDGRAYHKRILEGKEAFYEQYAPEYEDDNDPAMLRTTDDLREFLSQHGLPKTFPNKEAGISRILNVMPDIRIKDAEIAKHKAANAGKELISAEKIRYIEFAAKLIESDPQY